MEEGAAAYNELREMAKSARKRWAFKEARELEDEARREKEELERWVAEKETAQLAAEAEEGYGFTQRPYTPISPEQYPGRFQLLVRRYDAWGVPDHPST